MYGCYVEVVFHFVAKAILFLCFFGFDIIISLHTLSFFKMFFIILKIITQLINNMHQTLRFLHNTNAFILNHNNAIIIINVIMGFAIL